MDGFEKIELQAPSPAKANSQSSEQKTQPTNQDYKAGKSRLGKLKSRKLAALIIGLIVAFVVLIVIPSFLVYSSAMKTYAQVKVTMAALKNQDIEQTAQELKKTRESLEDTQSTMN